MKDHYTSFETAKALKESGFDFERDTDTHDFFPYNQEGGAYSSAEDEIYYGITQSLLQKWLREKHCIHIQIMAEGIDVDTGNTNWCYSFVHLSDEKTRILYRKGELGQDADLLVRPDNSGVKDWYLQEHSTYEEALENGLIHALEMICYPK